MDCTTILCEGILIEILARLPAKSLIRFMAVCRKWKSIISSPQFRLVSDRPAKVLFHTNQESYTLIEDDEDNLLIFETESPLRHFCYGEQYEILGSDNGLLCFGTEAPIAGLYYCVTIWNPSIRKHVEVPDNPIVQEHITHELFYAYGFGGTISGSDYKYVMFLGYSVGDCLINAADIYSLKTGTWRRKHLDHDNWCELRGSCFTCALLRGRLHWIGGDKSRSYAINSFELEDEVLVGNINLPEEVSIQHNITSVTVLKESLAVFACDQEGRQTTVWVMEEYIDVNSWIKLCVIDLTIERFSCFPRIMVHLLKNGDLLLGLIGCSKKNPVMLVTYNPKTRKTSDFGVGVLSLSQVCGFTIHKESLVLLGDHHCEDREVLPPMLEQSLVQAQPLQGHPYGYSLHQYASVLLMNNPNIIQVGYFPAWTGAGFYWYPLFKDQYGNYYAWTGFYYRNTSLII